MENFTPVSALVGGALIGLAAAIYIVVIGRVAGVSGILGGMLSGILKPRPGQTLVQIAFLAGLVAGPLLVRAAGGPVPAIAIDASLPIVIVGGLLTGFGTRLGGGCTSGHGVCGVARLSPRSIAATVLFMAAGAAVVFVARHVVGG